MLLRRTRRVFFRFGQSELETHADFARSISSHQHAINLSRFLPHKSAKKKKTRENDASNYLHAFPSGGSRHSLTHLPPSPTHIQPPQWPPSAPWPGRSLAWAAEPTPPASAVSPWPGSRSCRGCPPPCRGCSWDRPRPLPAPAALLREAHSVSPAEPIVALDTNVYVKPNRYHLPDPHRDYAESLRADAKAGSIAPTDTSAARDSGARVNKRNRA